MRSLLSRKPTVGALLLALLMNVAGFTGAAFARSPLTQEAAAALRPDSATVARRLSDRNPFVRRQAAEELARLVAVEHRRLIEGYRLQEKDARARVALDWALYRMGRSESLFPLVDALDSKKLSEQVIGYLKQLETPEPLYVFLNRVNGNTRIRLLEVLAGVGNEETLERIKPFTASLDPGIADAAKFAEREITIRLGERLTVEPKRERRVGADPIDPLN
jgi:HEAT repeat protein